MWRETVVIRPLIILQALPLLLEICLKIWVPFVIQLPSPIGIKNWIVNKISLLGTWEKLSP